MIHLGKEKKEIHSVEPFKREHESYYTIPGWKGVTAGITTKNGGVSSGPFHSFNMGLHVGDDRESVVENRRRLSELIGFPLARWVAAEQTHGDCIELIDGLQAGKGSKIYDDAVPDTDCFLASSGDLLLTMCYADCVPLYFYDPVKRRIGLAHAGWKGTVAKIGPSMIDRMVTAGSSKADIEVVIGPSICGDCYVVDDFVIGKIEKVLEDGPHIPYNLKEEGQYHLDLKQLNRLLLIQSGISAEQIRTSGHCSFCHDDFYSYRQDGGKTGRMMSFIGWKENVHER